MNTRALDNYRIGNRLTVFGLLLFCLFGLLGVFPTSAGEPQEFDRHLDCGISVPCLPSVLAQSDAEQTLSRELSIPRPASLRVKSKIKLPNTVPPPAEWFTDQPALPETGFLQKACVTPPQMLLTLQDFLQYSAPVRAGPVAA